MCIKIGGCKCTNYENMQIHKKYEAKKVNIYRNRYAPCAGKNKAHTQTNKHDREHKLTSFLLFVTRHIVSIETDQSSLQNSKAVKDHVRLCTKVFVSCRLK